ncbi:Hypothetical predicted protein, partial [Scomber scombrus]
RVLTHREMCHGATACSTAVTQFRDFFTRTATAGERRNPASKNQTRWAPLKLHDAPKPQPCSLPHRSTVSTN